MNLKRFFLLFYLIFFSLNNLIAKEKNSTFITSFYLGSIYENNTDQIGSVLYRKEISKDESLVYESVIFFNDDTKTIKSMLDITLKKTKEKTYSSFSNDGFENCAGILTIANNGDLKRASTMLKAECPTSKILGTTNWINDKLVSDYNIQPKNSHNKIKYKTIYKEISSNEYFKKLDSLMRKLVSKK